jgi:[methyl-Co(III) methanol-specific corrinoid protein]:coenzyme M methyltransferase
MASNNAEQASKLPSARDNLLSTLRGESPAYRPVISVCQYATYELMKKTGASWPKAHNDPKEMATLAAGGYTVFGLDALRVPYGQTTEAEAFGAVIKDGGPTILPSIDRHPYSLDDTPVFPPDFLERAPIPAMLEAISLLKQQYGGKVAIMGGVCGPFSIAANLLGVSIALKNSKKNPPAVRPFIEVGLQAGIALADACCKAGADIITVEDMMASMSMISPTIYRDLVLEYEKKLIAQIKLPVILHICGHLDPVIVEVAGTGAAVISIESAVDLPGVKARLAETGMKPLFAGTIDPLEILRNGNPDAAENAVKQAVAQGVDIVAPGCALTPDTPAANVIRMVAAGRGA